MSYCTLHRAVKSNALALCCLHDGALETYLKEHAHLKQIVLCLDADEPGRKAAERIKTEYTLKGYAVSMQSPAHGKDWNEYLQHHKKQRERGR
jgi:DNA primase